MKEVFERDQEALIEHVAKSICPYAWNDELWQDRRHKSQYDRNQQHVQRNARAQARLAIEAADYFRALPR